MKLITEFQHEMIYKCICAHRKNYVIKYIRLHCIGAHKLNILQRLIKNKNVVYVYKIYTELRDLM